MVIEGDTVEGEEETMDELRARLAVSEEVASKSQMRVIDHRIWRSGRPIAFLGKHARETEQSDAAKHNAGQHPLRHCTLTWLVTFAGTRKRKTASTGSFTGGHAVPPYGCGC